MILHHSVILHIQLSDIKGKEKEDVNLKKLEIALKLKQIYIYNEFKHATPISLNMLLKFVIL